MDRLPGRGAALSHGAGRLHLRHAPVPAVRRHQRPLGLQTVVEVNSIIATECTHNPGPAQRLHAAEQPDAVQARRAPVPVLRPAFPEQPAVARSHSPAQPGRPRHLDERRDGLPPLQQPEGVEADAGIAAALLAVQADIRRVHLSRAGACSPTRWNTCSRIFRSSRCRATEGPRCNDDASASRPCST